ncbi:hypothetical protein [uncultured Ottowia sp.]|mgnify:CR=1 FL=1|uniref:hypothetical protein n=1 Tax=uncultured Ottowia sp. TaxID=543067 RepID=UPI0025990382|nr:hypothetical protein [uncultured Ottowia sp.]
MRGFRPGKTGWGPVQGPGTATSDSVRGGLARGSYVMPADSTAAIGAETLAGMGRGLPGYSGRSQNALPVALSRGEFVLAPEQVHSIGAQALDAMRAGTHQWVAPGAQDSQRLFLANGGLVDEEERRRQQASFGDAAAAARDGGVRQIASAANHIPGYVAQRGAPDGAAVVPQPPPDRPKTFTEDVLDTAARDAQAGWRQGGVAGMGQAAGALARGAATAIPAAFVDAADDVVNGPPGRFVGGLWRGLTGGGNEAQASQAQERQPAASQPAPQTERAPQAAGLPSYAPPGNQPQTPSASAGLPSRRQFGGQPGGEMADGQIHYAPSTRTYSGRDIGADAAFASSRSGGGNLSVLPGSEGVERAQRAASIYQGMAAPAAGLPANGSGGSSWQRRNDLQNMETGAWKLRSSWEKFRDGSLRHYSPQQQAYMAEAKAQAEDFGKQALLQQEAMRQQGENQRALLGNTYEQAKLDLLARQQDEAERKGAIERGTAGLGFTKALRIEQAQNALMHASTPKEQAQALQRLAWLTGDEAKGGSLKDNFATVGGGQEWDEKAQTIRNVPQRLIDLRTGREVGQPSPPPRAIHEDRAALSIKNDTSLTRQQKEDALRALGYT